MQRFREIYAPGNFYSDKTLFIRQIEALQNGRAIIALFPRRFGKSAFLDTLGEYYDVRNKDSFVQLFGHLDIGQHPTALRSRFMILPLRFFGIATKSYEAFDTNFDEKIVEALRRFKDDYNLDFKIDEKNGILSFERLWSAVRSKAQKDPNAPGVSCCVTHSCGY